MLGESPRMAGLCLRAYSATQWLPCAVHVTTTPATNSNVSMQFRSMVVGGLMPAGSLMKPEFCSPFAKVAAAVSSAANAIPIVCRA